MPNAWMAGDLGFCFGFGKLVLVFLQFLQSCSKYTKKLIIKLDIRQDAGKMLIMHIMEIIRCEVEKSPESRRQICIATEIDETAMHRIMEKNGSCMVETAEKLLTYFGYELKKKKRRK